MQHNWGMGTGRRIDVTPKDLSFATTRHKRPPDAPAASMTSELEGKARQPSAPAAGQCGLCCGYCVHWRARGCLTAWRSRCSGASCCPPHALLLVAAELPDKAVQGTANVKRLPRPECAAAGGGIVHIQRSVALVGAVGGACFRPQYRYGYAWSLEEHDSLLPALQWGVFTVLLGSRWERTLMLTKQLVFVMFSVS
jgi:hypothetical protein